MRSSFGFRLGMGAFLLASCNAPEPASEPAVETRNAPGLAIALSADEVKQLGIVTQPVTPYTYVSEAEGYGAVESIAFIVEIDSDLTKAEGAGDAAQLRAAQDKAAANLGAAPWLWPDLRKTQMARFASGEDVLVHVVFPPGALPDGTAANVKLAPVGGSAPPAAAQSLWEAPADPATPGSLFFAIASGHAFSPGGRVAAFAAVGAETPGVLIPKSAVVFNEGSAFAYVALDAATFLRRPIDLGHPVAGGYFDLAQFAEGERVVTAGADALLAREMR